MTDTSPIHPLRQRMIDDMTLRGFNPGTQHSYMSAVRRCTAHMRKPPGALGAIADRIEIELLVLPRRMIVPAAAAAPNAKATTIVILVILAQHVRKQSPRYY